MTAFGPYSEGEGTLLRLWELAGTNGECVVTLPESIVVKAVQPVDLRGRAVGEPIPVIDHAFAVGLRPYAPASFVFGQ